MVDFEIELNAMVANRAKYQRVKKLAHAMGGRGTDPAAFYATGDLVTEWLAAMPHEMRMLVRLAPMLALHRHMTRTQTIRGVLAFDAESIVEWKEMAARDARPKIRTIQTP